MRGDGRCEFAHALGELRLPYEAARTYDGCWFNGVHRWYGQRMPPSVVEQIQWYYHREAWADIPVWAHGLMWYVSGRFDGQEQFPADFGIERDFVF